MRVAAPIGVLAGLSLTTGAPAYDRADQIPPVAAAQGQIIEIRSPTMPSATGTVLFSLDPIPIEGSAARFGGPR